MSATRTTRRSLVVAAALDEAALLHPVDDAGGARLGHVERLGEAAHRERAVDVEDGQDVEVDEAERAARPVAHVAHGGGGTVRGELVEEVAEDGLAVHGLGIALSGR